MISQRAGPAAGMTSELNNNSMSRPADATSAEEIPEIELLIKVNGHL